MEGPRHGRLLVLVVEALVTSVQSKGPSVVFVSLELVRHGGA